MNLLNMSTQGGWLMIPILFCSIIAAYVIVERFLVIRKSRSNTRQLMMKIKSLILKERRDEAITLTNETPGPAAKVLKQGLIRANRSKEEIKDAIESAGREEIFFLERNLGYLATIAGVAPLIGFLGTVWGMMEAFMEIQNLEGNVNAAVLAGGIWQALITTAAGLAVGIVTFIFYNILTSKVQRFVFEIESSSNELVELLTEDNYQEHSFREI
ncbi:MotA/TolQ/ExbB proton channel family protein [candidate division KSB1 bacterium]